MTGCGSGGTPGLYSHQIRPGGAGGTSAYMSGVCSRNTCHQCQPHLASRVLSCNCMHACLCFRCWIWLDTVVCEYLGRPCSFTRQHAKMILQMKIVAAARCVQAGPAALLQSEMMTLLTMMTGCMQSPEPEACTCVHDLFRFTVQ